MSKTVQGFGVRNQQRRKMRSDLTGAFETRQWIIRNEEGGLFWWNIGKMSGYAGPTLADVLRQMRKASRAQSKIEAEYGELPADRLQDLSKLLRWELMSVQGRLKVTGPHGKGEKEHYRVFITPEF
jgi:hypothetical protein